MVTVEKITGFDDHSIIYRLSIQAGGNIIHQEVVCGERDTTNPNYIKHIIKLGIDRLLSEVKDFTIHNLQRLYRETGDYDTTVHARPSQQARNLVAQEAIRQQQRGIMAGNIFNNSFSGAIAGNFGDNFLNPPDTKKEDKAMKLLKTKIGKRKFKALGKKGYFEEKGKHGIYRFHMDNIHGVTCIKQVKFGNKKRPLEWDLCIQSSVPDMPKGDIILSRWMEFKADEDKFIKIANFRNVRTTDEATTTEPPINFGLSFPNTSF